MQIEVQGLEEAKNLLIKLSQFANNQHMQDIMQTIGQMLRNKTEEAFSDKKSPFGKRWEPLKPSTLKAKKAKGDILRFTGSLQDRWNIEATNSKVIVSGNSVKNSYAYGIVHQFGTSNAGKNKNTKIPARKFLPIDNSGKIEDGLKDTIENMLNKELKKCIY